MSNNPTVTLTFAGDSSKLSKAFEDVGSSAKNMSTDLKKSADDATSAGKGMENLVESADTVDTRAMGFRDTITGLQDTFKGLSDDSLSLGDRLFTLGAGVGDLASGFVNLLGPAIGSVWQKLVQTTAAQWLLTAAQTAWTAVTGVATTAMAALNAVMRANPILFIVGLIATLVGAFILLWNKSEGFRNFFIGMWNGIKSVVGAVIDWIKGAWNGMISFFSGIVNAIGNVFSGIGNAIKNAFKAAINFVIDILNGAVWALNKIIDGINFVPGVEIPHIPKIPRLHTGGVVPGMLGSEQLAILQAGERVVPRGQGGNNGATVVFAGDTDSAFSTAFMKLVRTGQIRITT